jgi:hypothetical protein
MEKEELTQVLEQDEKLLWSGRPAHFQVLDAYYKPVFIKKCLIFGALGILLITAYILYCIYKEIPVSAIFLVILVGIPIAAVVPKYKTYQSFGSSCRYYLTDKAVIAHVSESQRLRLPYSGIEGLEAVPQSEGTTTIRIGSAVGIPAGKNRDHAINCLYFIPNGEPIRYCVLFNLTDKDAEQVMDLIRSRKPTAA